MGIPSVDETGNNSTTEHLAMSIGQLVSLACILEVSAPKPGNVHRSADFEDTCLIDFLASAVAIGQIFERVKRQSVGQTVLESIKATKEVTTSNTNLGLVLLLAPLAHSVDHQALEAKAQNAIQPFHVQSTLSQLDSTDAANIFSAIGFARPGGLGDAEKFDVNRTDGSLAPKNILEAMELAKHRDSVALQYTNEFSTVFDLVWPFMESCLSTRMSLTDAIVLTHVKLMSEIPDTLIERKCGRETAQKSTALAGKAIELWQAGRKDEYLRSLSDLDFWLRADGNRRNPGTTADLIGATIFVGLVNRKLVPPFH